MWNQILEFKKSAIVTHLQALNFNFDDFLHFFKAEIYQIDKIEALKMAKMAYFALLESPKLISRKFSVIEKSWNFHTVYLEYIQEHVVDVPRQLFQLQIEQYWFCPGNPHWK